MHGIDNYMLKALPHGCLPLERSELNLALNRDSDEDMDYSCIDRRNMDGHFTASAVVLDETRQYALMVHHKALGKLLFPGGHIDPYEDAMIAAFREVWEETGYRARPLLAFPIDFDSHPIPANKSKNEGDHRHHDMLFLGEASRDSAPIAQLEEVSGVEWVPVSRIEQMPNPRFNRVVKMLKRLRQI